MVCMVAGEKFNLHFSLLRVKMDAEKTTVALKEVNIFSIGSNTGPKYTILFYVEKCFCNMYI